MQKRGRIAVLDTETTGLPNKNSGARIIEVAAVLIDASGRRLDTFESLCNPGLQYILDPDSGQAFTIHGIRTEWLTDAPPSWAIGAALRTWLINHQVQVVTSYHTEFDFHPLLLCAPEWLAPVMPPIQLGPCCYQWADTFMGRSNRSSRLTLCEAAKAFNVSWEGTSHSALADALVAAEILRKLILGRSPGNVFFEQLADQLDGGPALTPTWEEMTRAEVAI